MGKKVELNGEVKDISKNACLVNVDGVTGWVPDSEADYIDEPEVGKEMNFIIPEWLSITKGFTE